MKNLYHSAFLLEVVSASFISKVIIRYTIDTSHAVVAYQFLKNSIVHKFNIYIIKAEATLTINTGFITSQCCMAGKDKFSHCRQCLLSEWICSHVFHTIFTCFSCPLFSSKHFLFLLSSLIAYHTVASFYFILNKDIQFHPA